MIDIGRSSTRESRAYYSNQVVNESTLLLGRDDNYAPPPYSGPSTEFCSQCGVRRQDSTAKFC